MCSLYGVLRYGQGMNNRAVNNLLNALARESSVRGDHATGIAYFKGEHLNVFKKPKPAKKLKLRAEGSDVVMGHTRFTTQGNESINHNNHPFWGNVGGHKFAFAHNGIITNDRSLRRTKQLPETDIETDSYVCVQLIEKLGELTFESLSEMGEELDGYWSFTLLDDRRNLWLMKGESPLYIIRFPVLNLIVYSSTKDIMNKTLAHFKNVPAFEEIEIDDGQILKIDQHGKLEYHEYEYNPRSFNCYGYNYYYDDYYGNYSSKAGYKYVKQEDGTYKWEWSAGSEYDDLPDEIRNSDAAIFAEELICYYGYSKKYIEGLFQDGGEIAIEAEYWDVVSYEGYHLSEREGYA